MRALSVALATLALSLFAVDTASAQKGGGGGGGRGGGPSGAGGSIGGAARAGVGAPGAGVYRGGTVAPAASIYRGGTVASGASIYRGGVYPGGYYASHYYPNVGLNLYHNHSHPHHSHIVLGGGYGNAYYYAAGFGYNTFYPSLPYLPLQNGTLPNGTLPNGTLPNGTTAEVLVTLPDADGEVWFDGKKTRQVGTVRQFVTPALDGDYSYNVSAAWHQDGRLITQERTVSVAPGARVAVDFTQLPFPPLPTPVK